MDIDITAASTFRDLLKQGLKACPQIKAEDVSGTVLSAVNEFCQNMEQEDDISLIDIPCGGWQQTFAVHPFDGVSIQNKSSKQIIDNDAAWTWSLHLTGHHLAKVNPIPVAMNQIHEIEGNAEHWQSLFTILTELFINSLDHGVLGLSSDLKSSAEGFAEYFTERERQLKKISSGFIDLQLSYFKHENGGKIVVRIKDSGEGFNHETFIVGHSKSDDNYQKLSGRGIELVKQLCESLTYQERGSLVEASYVWNCENGDV
jgi:hypothetical protein